MVETTAKTLAKSYAPLDLSFRNILEPYGVYFARLRDGAIPLTFEKTPSTRELPEWFNENKSDVDLFTFEQLEESQTRITTESIKLNNNELTTLENIIPSIQWHLSFDVTALKSLDLSFNHISSCSDTLAEFPNLVSLYLHGNKIMNVDECKKLGSLKNLKCLALHGNPIDQTRQYRWNIISMVPSLNRLDFSLVTKSDKLKADTLVKKFKLHKVRK